MHALDALRAAEDGYRYLDEGGHVYLDHTGAGLPARAQLWAHAERIAGGCFGNPHSVSPASEASGELVERARRRVLAHFGADPREYAVVFTANATGACRLVGEAYPFAPGGRLVLTLDNHNSVNGLREYARSRGADTVYVPLRAPGLDLDAAAMDAVLAAAPEGGGLLAYPAQSNFSGVRHSLDWITRAKAAGWDVLLDAAAYVPTNPLDLAAVHPDFVAVSWYKVFGYPTGVGCLVARRDALARLRRPWFSGGTIHVVSAQGLWHHMAEGEAAFEDGTVNYLSIPDIEFGLDWIRAIGTDAIHRHVTALTAELLDGLAALRHSGGEPLARVYGPSDTTGRGGTVALNLLGPDGAVVDERIVARDSAAHRISLRTGCFCNPGTGEAAFAIERRTLDGAVRTATGTIDDYLGRLGLPSGGAVRVSLGLSSSRADVAAFLDFVAGTYRDRRPDPAGLSPRLVC
ncbi:Selenocysteine lyase/Cysteine desulfurase [Actinacidiphila yanglinensis]|uniref:Selenocysteine lyase/Cysteine desulfurase n=1 Tax=Actinacidiphila yanglinensis TaxID=310779 RepID=A0A1H5TZD4_9ACTN|nr:aminotransferase class V-fold PLP-dependent enzyme [Actinacidiphila yanglinensis]SEF68232.1 Selenocysteine lyase/Cysteine desulfurase [Actinacidiphila yanglinensis]